MHFKALSILLALLCFNAFGALAAPTRVYRRSPYPPAPTHYDDNNPAHRAAFRKEHSGGYFHPLHAVSIGRDHAMLAANKAQDIANLRVWEIHGGPRPRPLPHPPLFLGQGAHAQVFAVPHPVHNHHAVIKVFHPSHGVLDHNAFRTEIRNSAKAGQYLGHGYHNPSDTHYLIQKHMGKSQPQWMTAQHVAHAQAEARHRYTTQHGITHLDAQNPANYVYHPAPVPGGVKAELIDWGNAKIHTPPPSPQKGPFGLPKFWRK